MKKNLIFIFADLRTQFTVSILYILCFILLREKGLLLYFLGGYLLYYIISQKLIKLKHEIIIKELYKGTDIE